LLSRSDLPPATLSTGATAPAFAPTALLKQLDLLSRPRDGQRGGTSGGSGAARDGQSDAGTTVAPWADHVASQVRQLADALARPDAAEHVACLVEQLRDAVERVEPLADRLEDGDAEIRVLRTGYAVLRRLDIWESIMALDRSDRPTTDRMAQPDRGMVACLEELAATPADQPIGRAWRDYLMFDTRAMASHRGPRGGDAERTFPKTILAKIDGRPNASPARLVDQVPVASWRDARQRWGSGPIDTRRIVEDLEAFEVSESPSDAGRVALDHLLLSRSDRRAARALAGRIETHYRNANIRLAISATLINRSIPQPPVQQQPVWEMIAGARVHGRSEVSNRLLVRCIADPRRIRLGLEARGTIDSNTASTSGPATFFSRGSTYYEAAKLILIGPTRVDIFPAIADAKSAAVLTSLATQFDSLPLVRSLVRSMALAQHERRLDEALRESERKVARRIRRQLDARAGEQIEIMRGRWRAHVLDPLDRLGLEPTPCETRTTGQRVIVRARLATDAQLGAHTPRPRAPPTSQFSLQVHQSALQNVIDQLQLDGRRLTLPELYRLVAGDLGVTNIIVPEDLAEDALVQFAPRHAVRIAFADRQVRVTLALAELAQRRRRFHHFSVTATYRPETSPGGPQLVRAGIVHLQGARLRTRQQIILRGVFAKLFPRNRPISLFRRPLDQDPRFRGLEVGQFVIDDGWLGLALGPRDANVALSRDTSSAMRR